MRYISLFSGFGGAELAWGPLGWECAAVAEVEPAACAVLAHHWPHVPNLGDVEKITEEQIALLDPVDMVVFGSPCQDLSVAGKRGGLKGERSGLFFDAMRIVRWSGARFALWENVPGAFSSQEGRDFALVAGEMAGVRADVPNGGWCNSGFLLGADGLVEWAVLDAQFFGVPQRRRRIFALRDIGDWQSRPSILLERESLCGHPAPSRKAGQVAPTIPARSLGGGGLGTDFDCDGGAIASTGDISHCLNGGGMGRQDYETETLISFQNTGHGYWQQRPIAQTVRTPDGGGSLEANLVTHSLSADGFDASEDGTGRGTPLIPVERVGVSHCVDCDIEIDCFYIPGTEMLAPIICPECGDSPGCITYDVNHGGTAPIGFWGNQGGQDAIEDGFPTLRANTLGGGNCPAVAFRASGQEGFTPNGIAPPITSTDGGGAGVPTVAYGIDEEQNGSEELMGCLKARKEGGGFEAAVAFNLRGREGGSQPELTDVASVRSASGGSSRSYVAGMQVRRLTPIETARLQGLPDLHCHIPYKGRMMADGPIYKMHGNGFCVNVVRWIGEALERVICT